MKAEIVKSGTGTFSATLVIRTAKSDKYDRYLADLFVEDHYLNQELNDQGHAVTVKS